MTDSQGAPTRVQLLQVAVDDTQYALETGHVDEVLEAPALSPMPHSNDAVAGVARVRGEVVAVLDAGVLADHGPVDAETAVLLESDPASTPVALLVDEVRDMERTPVDRFAPASERGIDPTVFAAGVATDSGVCPVFGPERLAELVGQL